MTTAAGAEDDPYLWLEEVEGEEALGWVRAQNEVSQGELEGDPRFSDLYQEALSILTSKARLAYGQIHNGQVYNFWQDDTHVRGLWRRASVESYRSGEPEWETILDFDKLAKDEDRNWIRGDTVCLSPEYRYCMVELSDGGKDAAYWREFDTETKSFVDGGFALPEGKSWIDWIDENTLLVGAEWGEDSLTTSGYPRELRRWSRGAPMGEGQSVMTVDPEDVWVFPIVEHDGDMTYEFAMRGPSFFERE